MKFARGFTLIELLVTIGIISVLVAMGAVAYTSAQASARDARRKSDLQDFKKALYLHKTDYGTFVIGGYLACCGGSTWSSSVDNPTYGENPGTAANSMTNVLVVNNKYMKYIPRDPKFNTPSTDYYVHIGSPDQFVLSATLERPPTSNVGCTPQSGRNYCITD